MLKRLVTASRSIIVHNPAALRIIFAHDPIPPVGVPLHDCRVSDSAVGAAPDRDGNGGAGNEGGGHRGEGLGTKTFEIPHLFVPPALPSAIDTLRLRAELGLGPRTLLAGVFGHLRESKRLHAILRAMNRLWESGVDIKLLVQGAFASSDLERAISPILENHPRILRRGHLSELDFWRYAAATDVCLNLRFPTAGETSGIAIRMIGIGKTVIFSGGDETTRFPNNACLRVDHGPAEEAMLADYLRWLASSPEVAREIGRQGAAHIAREHSIERVASLYWDALAKAAQYQ
jgi:glycosyltransferase involved in cell wall biosynthesis